MSQVRKSRQKPEKADSKPRDSSPRVQVDVNASDLLGTFWSMFEHYDRKRRNKQHTKRQVLKSKVLHLAEYYQGIVGVPDLLMQDWCDREEACDCFQDLQAEGHCHFFTTYNEEDLYVFPALVMRIWNCEHCGSNYAARKSDTHRDVCSCGNCGAQLRLTLA